MLQILQQLTVNRQLVLMSMLFEILFYLLVNKLLSLLTKKGINLLNITSLEAQSAIGRRDGNLCQINAIT